LRRIGQVLGGELIVNDGNFNELWAEPSAEGVMESGNHLEKDRENLQWALQNFTRLSPQSRAMLEQLLSNVEKQLQLRRAS
jgi:hypothetical protein